VAEPNLRVPRIQELQLKAGVPQAVVDNLPSAVRLFSQHELPADTLAPLDAPAIAWSFKQTSLAVATLLYAAQDHGVATGPMEGFYEAKVREVLGIPDRYKVSIIVALGYPKEGTRVHDTTRLPPTEVFFEGEFGQSSEKLFQA
jgi:nitroreductase